MAFFQTGGCQCGALRYEISESPILTYTCHCTECQRLTGSAFGMAVIVPADAFHLSGPEPRRLHRIADSGRTATRLVCPECGTWICGEPRPGTWQPRDVRAVRAGSLDDTSWLRPTIHFWTRSAQPWVVLPDGAEVFATQPDP